jgi:hypothetical protein
LLVEAYLADEKHGVEQPNGWQLLHPMRMHADGLSGQAEQSPYLLLDRSP